MGVESGRAVADVSRETARQAQKQLVKKGYAAKKRAENTQKELQQMILLQLLIFQQIGIRFGIEFLYS